jgi:hypothetical protein
MNFRLYRLYYFLKKIWLKRDGEGGVHPITPVAITFAVKAHWALSIKPNGSEIKSVESECRKD